MEHKDNTLHVQYASPTAQHKFEQMLPALPQGSNAQSNSEKTEYLAALRRATMQMQTQVNELLTQKMEEDKLNDAAAGETAEQADEKAEEMYGEEAEDEG